MRMGGYESESAGSAKEERKATALKCWTVIDSRWERWAVSEGSFVTSVIRRPMQLCQKDLTWIVYWPKSFDSNWNKNKRVSEAEILVHFPTCGHFLYSARSESRGCQVSVRQSVRDGHIPGNRSTGLSRDWSNAIGPLSVGSAEARWFLDSRDAGSGERVVHQIVKCVMATHPSGGLVARKGVSSGDVNQLAARAHVCGTQRLTPRRRPTATRTASSSRRRPQADMVGRAASRRCARSKLPSTCSEQWHRRFGSRVQIWLVVYRLGPRRSVWRWLVLVDYIGRCKYAGSLHTAGFRQDRCWIWSVAETR